MGPVSTILCKFHIQIQKYIFDSKLIVICRNLTNLDPASGTTFEWAYEKKNITLAYTMEFRPHRRTPGYLQSFIFYFYNSVRTCFK